MYHAPNLFETVTQKGGEDHERRLNDDSLSERLSMQQKMFMFWGQQIRDWSIIQHVITTRGNRLPLPVLDLKKYPFSDQKATFDTFISHLLAFQTWKDIRKCSRDVSGQRLELARGISRDSTTRAQRIFVPLVLLLFEVFMPLLWLLCLVGAILVRVVLQTGIRLPVLSFFYFMIRGSGIPGAESLPPGENGYTKVFQGGDDVDLDDLEKELMKRNEESPDDHSETFANTISISYKHYANKGKVPGDDHRICRTDLQAIAQFIKVAAPCKLRFWIDAKLPPTSDDTFERWLNRGVRPYGRYITFLCPSSQQYAESSFWLSNEYHFANSAKGAMYFEGDQIFYELKSGYRLELYRRFLHVLIEAERHPVQVRDQDKGKVINWAMCCLRANKEAGDGMLSPNIDNLTMVGEYSHHRSLLNNITSVIRKFGPQELPVVHERSWNKDNPLLLDGLPHQDFDLANWYGLSLDESPETVYFLHDSILLEVQFDTVVVLEVTLDKPHFTPGKIRVIRKVLLEVSSSVLVRCKYVALPWLCDWE